jgi:hypothetical protein
VIYDHLNAVTNALARPSSTNNPAIHHQFIPLHQAHNQALTTQTRTISAITTTSSQTPKHANKMAERAPSPTPSERSRLDTAAKAKEQEEQSKLPYKWTQTIADLEVTIEVPGNFKGKDLDVKIRKDGVKAGIKGQDAVIEVCEMVYWG